MIISDAIFINAEGINTRRYSSDKIDILLSDITITIY